MSATYEPGTLAVATVRGVPNVRVMRKEGVYPWGTASDMPGSGRSGMLHTDAEVTDVHPLVVLDLPKGALAGWPVLVNALRTAREKTGYHLIFDGLIDQIEAQTRPPKPAEPTGLGAQVRDRDGEMWVRNVQGAWINLHGRYGLDPARTWDGLCEKYGPIEVVS